MITYTITFTNNHSINLVFPSSCSIEDIRTQVGVEVAKGFYANSTTDFTVGVAT
jgi:hypothetical protein